ncbi:MAG: nucleotide sugar dehydrogenase [Halochromatium sp.]|uniref:nucleotide sugar dehydrogenase n=1 Tax=Halochromatium sp. TaxID=2049430 RepID=UPI00397A6CF1
MQTPYTDDIRIAVIGLGYVGLPLAVELAPHFLVTGFDVDASRIEELKAGHDRTREATPDELASASVRLRFTTELADIRRCNVFIVTVPTPIDRFRQPDLGPLLRASESVGSCLSHGDVVIYESTVYPGATEEDCVPVLERCSGLTCNRDFSVGYSPERVNPGDRAHRIPDIIKITSGSTPETARFVDALYGRITRVGTHPAANIRVAEAAKVIENTQRDVNIALINELAQLFHRLGLDTEAVLSAAGTKWNFLPFRPGLVGGHCIGVDPYYLTQKAQAIGFHPEMILSGRRTNDGMGPYVAERVMKLMMQRRISVVDSRILILGATFKENCPDLRSSRVIDIVGELMGFNAQVDIHDPWADAEAVRAEFGVDAIEAPSGATYDAIIIAVGHNEFRERGAAGLRAWLREPGVFYDVKSVFAAHESDERL